MTERMEINYDRQLNILKNIIDRKIIRNYRGKKKYQVRNTFMLMQIYEYIKENNYNIQCKKYIDKTTKRKKLVLIEASYDSGCCNDCDSKICFCSDFSPVIYAELTFD